MLIRSCLEKMASPLRNSSSRIGNKKRLYNAQNELNGATSRMSSFSYTSGMEPLASSLSKYTSCFRCAPSVSEQINCHRYLRNVLLNANRASSLFSCIFPFELSRMKLHMYETDIQKSLRAASLSFVDGSLMMNSILCVNCSDLNMPISSLRISVSANESTSIGCSSSFSSLFVLLASASMIGISISKHFSIDNRFMNFSVLNLSAKIKVIFFFNEFQKSISKLDDATHK